ncbi:MAG TPA: dienelactone hydrolase family protein [Sphingomonas sp.]
MGHETVSIRTRDGNCPAHVLTPAGEGPWPAVIVFMDALSMRPALVEMAARLAGSGYVVLLPDMFYRKGPDAPLDPKVVFAGDLMAVIGPFMAATGNDKAVEDSAAFLAYLDGRADVAGERIGVTGFCMGGAMALSVAGGFPDRVGAAASFHGGNLATDRPTSPHLFARHMKGEAYVAGADKDGSYPLEMQARLDAALTEGGVVHRCEIYAGAAHGWMIPDFPVYDKASAERGWAEMLALFDRTLR